MTFPFHTFYGKSLAGWPWAPSVDHCFSVSFQKTQVQVSKGPEVVEGLKVISTGSSKSRISDPGYPGFRGKSSPRRFESKILNNPKP